MGNKIGIKPKEENQIKKQRIYKLNLMSTMKVVLLAAMMAKWQGQKDLTLNPNFCQFIL